MGKTKGICVPVLNLCEVEISLQFSKKDLICIQFALPKAVIKFDGSPMIGLKCPRKNLMMTLKAIYENSTCEERQTAIFGCGQIFPDNNFTDEESYCNYFLYSMSVYVLMTLTWRAGCCLLKWPFEYDFPICENDIFTQFAITTMLPVAQACMLLNIPLYSTLATLMNNFSVLWLQEFVCGECIEGVKEAAYFAATTGANTLLLNNLQNVQFETEQLLQKLRQKRLDKKIQKSLLRQKDEIVNTAAVEINARADKAVTFMLTTVDKQISAKLTTVSNFSMPARIPPGSRRTLRVVSSTEECLDSLSTSSTV